MLTELKRGMLFTIVTMVLLGGAYHGVIGAMGRMVFSHQADGSLMRDATGTVRGSSLVAQAFTLPEYFHPRPSAVDYNAASTGGSNYGPLNPDHLKLVRARLDARIALEAAGPGQVPSEMGTASGGGGVAARPRRSLGAGSGAHPATHGRAWPRLPGAGRCQRAGAEPRTRHVARSPVPGRPPTEREDTRPCRNARVRSRSGTPGSSALRSSIRSASSTRGSRSGTRSCSSSRWAA